MKRILVLFVIFFFLPAAVHAGGRKPPEKPLPPLGVSISPVEEGLLPADIKPGDTVQFRVTVFSFINTKEMCIEIKLSGGVELIEGETVWTGPVEKNEERTLLLTVRAPLKGKGRIKAKAVIPASRGNFFSARASYKLGEDVAGKAAESAPLKKKDGLGRDIIEYRVR